LDFGTANASGKRRPSAGHRWLSLSQRSCRDAWTLLTQRKSLPTRYWPGKTHAVECRRTTADFGAPRNTRGDGLLGLDPRARAVGASYKSPAATVAFATSHATPRQTMARGRGPLGILCRDTRGRTGAVAQGASRCRARGASAPKHRGKADNPAEKTRPITRGNAHGLSPMGSSEGW
jgi:hypothetical protein